jgi:hypothetical protein
MGDMEADNDKKKGKDFSLDSDSDEIQGGDIVGMDIDINFLDEKASAVHALGHLCIFAMPCLMDQLPKILATIKELEKYFHENIRYHICLTYAQIAIGIAKVTMGDFEKSLDWKKGLPVQVPLHPDVTKFLEEVVFAHYMEIFEDEQNKEVIEKLLECYVDIAVTLGPGAFSEATLVSLLKYLNQLL